MLLISKYFTEKISSQNDLFACLSIGIQSIISLTVLALQRFMMVTKDRQFPLSTPLSTLITIITIWSITALISCPPLLGWGQFSLNTLGVRCGYNTVHSSTAPN